MRYALVLIAPRGFKYTYLPPGSAVEHMIDYSKVLSEAGILISSDCYMRTEYATRLKFKARGSTDVIQGAQDGTEMVYGYWIIEVAGGHSVAVEWARKALFNEGLILDVKRLTPIQDIEEKRVGVFRVRGESRADSKRPARAIKKEENANKAPILTAPAGVRKMTGRIGHPRNCWGRMMKGPPVIPDPESAEPATASSGRGQAGVSTAGEETASSIPLPPHPSLASANPPGNVPNPEDQINGTGSGDDSNPDHADIPDFITTLDAIPDNDGHYHCTYKDCRNNNGLGYKRRHHLTEHVEFVHVHPHKYKCPEPKKGCRRGWPNRYAARNHYKHQHRKGSLNGEQLEKWLRSFDDAEPSGVESEYETDSNEGERFEPGENGWYHCPYEGCKDNEGDGYSTLRGVWVHIRRVHTERYKYKCPEPIEGRWCRGFPNKEAARRHYKAKHGGGPMDEQQLAAWLAKFDDSD